MAAKGAAELFGDLAPAPAGADTLFADLAPGSAGAEDHGAPGVDATVPRPAGPIRYTGAPDLPLEETLTKPSNLLGFALSAPLYGALAGPLKALPWLIRSGLTNAAAGATAGATTDIAERRNPLPAMLPNAAAGAVLGPAIEGTGGLAARGAGAAGRAITGAVRRAAAPAAERIAPGVAHVWDDALSKWVKAPVSSGVAPEWLHGTTPEFSGFTAPSNRPYGHGVIYFSEAHPGSPTQAEHIAGGPFGGKLIRAAPDLSKLTRFDPRNDPAAAEIMKRAGIEPNFVTPSGEKVYTDFVEYPDMAKIAPLAASKGYSLFRVREPSVQGFSMAVTDPSAIRVTKAELVPRGSPAVNPAAPFAPTSRAQQFPGLEDFAARIEQDPAYLDRLRALGGGRVVTNRETLQQAVNLGPMQPDEIANWKAGTAANSVDVTRAGLTMTYIMDRFQQAAAEGDAKGLNTFGDELLRISPGHNNLTAEPGRATQAQAMFVTNKAVEAAKELADMVKKGVPLDQVSRYARQQQEELAGWVRLRAVGEKLGGLVDAVQTYATRAKLTSPMTHAYNTVSNALTFWTIRPIQKLATAGAFAVQGDMPAARAETAQLFGSTSGLVNGGRRFLQVMMDDLAEAGKAGEAQAGMWKGGARWVDPFRWLSAADAFWKGVLRDQESYAMAYESAAREGLKGKALASRITGLTNNPPTAWAKRLDTVEKEYTFQQDPDAVLSRMAKVQGIPGVRFFIPFLKTPYNIIKFQFERSPAGVFSMRNLTGIAGGGRGQAEAWGRLGVGAVLGLSAYSLAERGEVTGGYPRDPRERARWDAAGIRPYSVKIGDRWLQYNRFAPLGMYLGQAAMLRDAVHSGDEKGAGAIAQQLAAGLGSQALDMPFLQGMSAFVDALQDPVHSGEKFFAGMASGLIPNFLRDVRYQTDITQRQARGLGPSVVNMLPGLSQTLPAKVDVLGREMRYNPNPLERATKVVGLPQESPTTEAMKAWGWSPSMPSPTLSVGKGKNAHKLTLKGDDLERFQREMGAATAKALDLLRRRPALAQMDQETRDQTLSDLVNRYRRVVRTRWSRALAAGKRP